MLTAWRYKPAHAIGVGCALAALLCAILYHAAVTQDAYVSFRVVDNAVHGYGLRWNVHERVQAYTNPLWMLLHIPFYFVWENIFYITLAISVVCTFAAIGITIHTFRKPAWQTVAILIIPLGISSSFTDYSTSGLENPLTHFLFALFGWALLKRQPDRFWFWLSFSCALSLVNRLDTAIFYAPIILYVAIQRFPAIRIQQCLLGSLPIVAWELFSLIYYGFLFPNTKYAKLNAGIAESEYLRHGLHYFMNLVALDMTSAGFLCVVAALPLYAFFTKTKYKPELLAVAWGILCYAVYVIYVGGNHVSGRFWSLPVFASIWVIYGMWEENLPRSWCLYAAAGLLAIRLVYPPIGILWHLCPSCFAGDIQVTGSRITLWSHLIYDRRLPIVHREHRPFTIILENIGVPGYKMGPATDVIDPNALSDPLLARLPSINRSIGRIGHLRRAIPGGYIFAVKTGSLARMGPNLAEYYSKLRLITSGDIWSWERFVTIMKFNMGDYDYLRDAYVMHARLRRF